MNKDVTITEPLGVCPVGLETHLLAEAASQLPLGSSALDLGTGTGFIGIYLAKKGFKVDAVDVNPKALEVAKQNAKNNGAHVNIFYSSWFDGITKKYDVIICNPPRNPKEGALSRLMSGFFRRSERLTQLVLPLAVKMFGNGRRRLLCSLLTQARNYLLPGGCVILHLLASEYHYLMDVFRNGKFSELNFLGEKEKEVIAQVRFL